MPLVDAKEVKGEAHHLLIAERAPSRQDQSKERPNQKFCGDQESHQYHRRHQQRTKIWILLSDLLGVSTAVCSMNSPSKRDILERSLVMLSISPGVHLTCDIAHIVATAFEAFLALPVLLSLYITPGESWYLVNLAPQDVEIYTVLVIS